MTGGAVDARPAPGARRRSVVFGPSSGTGAAAALLTLLLLTGSGPLRGQEVSRPPELEVELRVAPDPDTQGSALLRFGIPEGWVLYTPDAGPVGLPLEVAWRVDGRPATPRVAWPAGEPYATVAGPTRVWRGQVEAPVAGLAAQRGTTTVSAELRWALCRGSLCVPGRSRVVARLPGGPGGALGTGR